MKHCLSVLLVALTCCHLGSGLRILGMFPLNGHSHWVMAERLMLALAERGHQVDVVTHFPMKKTPPNYTQFSLDGSLKAVKNNIDAKTAAEFGKLNFDKLVSMAGMDICDLLSHENIQRFIKNPPNDPPYDLVVIEVFMAPCYLAFGRHLNVPIVSITTSAFSDWLEDVSGNPHNPAFVPSIFSSFGQRMGFWDRLLNTVLSKYVAYELNSRMDWMSKHVKDHFGIDVGARDLHKDIGLFLVNSHHSLNGIRPNSNGVVEVGGLHVTENGNPLSPEVEKWLDESTHGCIYFTFGSMIRIETFPEPTLRAIYTVFENIAPIRVLMKVAKKEDLLPGLPKNVMVQPWFPQVTVFKHKNIKAFITHGGLMGLQEAVYFGIPLVGVPIFGDQSTNLKNVAAKKLAVSLSSPDNITVESLSYALDKILNDDEYRTNMKRVSTLFKDRPMKAIDTAIYWVEYVGRHGNILRSPAIHLAWWQQKLLDVYGFLLACLLIVILVVVYVLRKITRLVFGCKSCSKTSSGKTSESKKRK
ncbi:UDP-glucosyltransferase 2 [Megalopta genalis]|uniref:UDP-glucosyltransferase 2 n=1 Tax=Megalopta genalis TaxID=115081 RepID=UPI003FD4453E